MATITTAFWHPFADMGAVCRRELTIERGEGVWVWDSEDNRYLDATASLWYANLGHARPEIADAVAAQMRRLEAYSTFGDFGNHPANDLCAEHGVLFVVDAVICGFGRLGTWFGIERWPEVRPDLITFAKGVTAGYLPLGGVIVSGRVAAPFFSEPGGPMLRHGATYAGHPTCCAAALAVIDVYERENLIARGRELEGPLQQALAPLADHPA